MENIEYVFAVAAILGGIAQLLLVIASSILVVKIRKLGTIFMLIGSVLMLINSLTNFILPIVFASKGPEYLAKSVSIQQIIGQIPLLIFVIGILIYAIQIKK
ncbi:hypothetical protein [Allomuricauda sp. d1]|uniref:hypothetical protein n=1 Tax=Allomuricauda sp. d1 TaxID=3136725 RepID=UPI0031CE858E